MNAIQNRSSPTSKLGNNLKDGRIDSYYKRIKSDKKNHNPSLKRTPPKRTSPTKFCDNKKCNINQKTLSPWLVKVPRLSPKCKRRKRRHILSPKKSAKLFDPEFRGATIWFDTKLTGNQSRLFITSYFTKTFPKRSKHVSKYDYAEEWSSENEDIDVVQSLFEREDSPGKRCASCQTCHTPLWRDAEDGTPLCNACGIRYRKYKRRCSGCWNIPKKGRTLYTCCSVCGSPFTHQRHITSRRTFK